MSIIIRKSKIQGKGAFANINFRKGDIVMKWDDSVILTKNEAKKIPKMHRKYLVLFKRKYIMAQSPEKYINHSCEPNTKEGKLCDIAARDIKKGEELTTDYSVNAPSHIKMECFCWGKKCRNII